MEKMINIDDFRGKWSSGEAICLKCGHTWDAICPENVTDSLECSECGLCFGRFRYPYALNVGEEVYQCDCGGQNFEIARDYYLCMICGTKHWREDVW